jgi:hypothetical protein
MKKLFITVLAFVALTANAQDPAYPPAPAAPLNVVKAEYFIDADPGFGLGTDIPLTAATDVAGLVASINTGALTAGAHKLYIRTLNAEGEWSTTTVRQFVADFDPAYPTPPAAAQNITNAEYFIDSDPGFGNGTNIPLTAATDIAALVASVNTSALTVGAHHLYIRTLNAEGKWALTTTRQFVVDFDPVYPIAPAAAQNINSAEYFIDTDPGFSNGTNIPVVAAVDIAALVANVNTNLLPAGAHRLYIRTRSNEGKWSVTSSSQFIVNDDPAYPAAPAAPGNITFAEYFFNTDPGFGNGTSIVLTPAVDINALTVPINTVTLTTGQHFFYIRSLDDWGLTSVRELQVNTVLPVTFVNFYGKPTGNNITLQWTTAAEQNSSHFEIQRSTDGRNFVSVGIVAAAGNSSTTNNYDFKDVNVAAGTYQYRLKQFDIDGRFIYSAVITIRMSTDNKIMLLPNPVIHQLEIKGVATNTPIRIYDASGSLLQTSIWNGTAIDVSRLSSGVYTVQVIMGETILVKKIVKQ